MFKKNLKKKKKCSILTAGKIYKEALLPIVMDHAWINIFNLWIWVCTQVSCRSWLVLWMLLCDTTLYEVYITEYFYLPFVHLVFTHFHQFLFNFYKLSIQINFTYLTPVQISAKHSCPSSWRAPKWPSKHVKKKWCRNVCNQLQKCFHYSALHEDVVRRESNNS